MKELPEYRAWYRGQMYTVCYIHLEKGNIGLYRGDTETAVWSINDIDLMQYTGHKGRNSKKIYEGDLVKVNGYDGIFQVIWGEFHDCCVNGETWVLSPTLYEPTIWYHTQYTGDDDEWLEVVGNIYENPELKPV